MSRWFDKHYEKEYDNFSREFAMPNSNTFEIQPIADLLKRVLPTGRVIIDPFARNSKYAAEYSNDLNPETDAVYHCDAIEWLDYLAAINTVADAVLLDPPYSPRQISECYKSVGRKVGMNETQNARLYKAAKDGLHKLLRKGGIAVTCGWNSGGFGIKRGYLLKEILLVNHGGAHNDTIVTVEVKA